MITLYRQFANFTSGLWKIETRTPSTCYKYLDQHLGNKSRKRIYHSTYLTRVNSQVIALTYDGLNLLAITDTNIVQFGDGITSERSSVTYRLSPFLYALNFEHSPCEVQRHTVRLLISPGNVLLINCQNDLYFTEQGMLKTSPMATVKLLYPGLTLGYIPETQDYLDVKVANWYNQHQELFNQGIFNEFYQELVRLSVTNNVNYTVSASTYQNNFDFQRVVIENANTLKVLPKVSREPSALFTKILKEYNLYTNFPNTIVFGIRFAGLSAIEKTKILQ